MESRIDKLLRQRDLLREHLKWIEDEIAAATPGTPPARDELKPAAAEMTPAGTQAVEDPGSGKVVAELSDDAHLPEPDVASVHSEVRAGCLLYFGIASALLGLLIAYIYWRY